MKTCGVISFFYASERRATGQKEKKTIAIKLNRICVNRQKIKKKKNPPFPFERFAILHRRPLVRNMFKPREIAGEDNPSLSTL